uniref:PLAT domain-containing protein n=1 Tax=Macrostomum lignano TaxID=282301 RepID=A0A1I8FRM1_9PLAT
QPTFTESGAIQLASKSAVPQKPCIPEIAGQGEISTASPPAQLRWTKEAPKSCSDVDNRKVFHALPSRPSEATVVCGRQHEPAELVMSTSLERRRIKGVFLETLADSTISWYVQDLTITITSELAGHGDRADPTEAEDERHQTSRPYVENQQELRLHDTSRPRANPALQWWVHPDSIGGGLLRFIGISQARYCTALATRCANAEPPAFIILAAAPGPTLEPDRPAFGNTATSAPAPRGHLAASSPPAFQFFITGLSFANIRRGSATSRRPGCSSHFTLFLTSVAFKFVINQSLPKISYLTYMVSTATPPTPAPPVHDLGPVVCHLCCGAAQMRVQAAAQLHPAVLTSVTFKYVVAQSLPRISYLTYMLSASAAAAAALLRKSGRKRRGGWAAAGGPVRLARRSEGSPRLASDGPGSNQAACDKYVLMSLRHPLHSQHLARRRDDDSNRRTLGGSAGRVNQTHTGRDGELWRDRLAVDARECFLAGRVWEPCSRHLQPHGDACRRRREMRKKDREYKEWLNKKRKSGKEGA